MESVATALELEDEPEAAIKVYDRILEMSNEPGAHHNLGNLYMQIGKPELAIPHYKSAAENDGASLPAVYNYAYGLSLLGDPNSAEHFRRAITLFEQTDMRRQSSAEAANYFQAVSHAYAGVGAYDKAQEALNAALELAKKLSPNRMVFSAVQYKHIPARQFVRETLQLLEGIQQKFH